MNAKLLDERPLFVLPSLAKAVGLNEAIILQQLYWTLGRQSVLTDDNGVRWISMTLGQWVEMFPFWSESTIRRSFQQLRDDDLVWTNRGRESNVYAINMAELEVKLSDPERSTCTDGSGQIEQSPCKREGTTREEEAASAAPDDAEPTLPGLEPPAPLPSQVAAARTGTNTVGDPKDPDVNEVWQHYLTIFMDRLRVKELTQPRARVIGKALKAVNGDVGLLKRACDGLKSYRTKHPDGSKDIGLAVIFETGPQSRSNLTDQIEWWAEQAADQAAIPPSVPSGHRARVMDLAVQVLKVEHQPDNQAVRERGKQAQAILAERFHLKVISDGHGKLLRFEGTAVA